MNLEATLDLVDVPCARPRLTPPEKRQSLQGLANVFTYLVCKRETGATNNRSGSPRASRENMTGLRPDSDRIFQ